VDIAFSADLDIEDSLRSLEVTYYHQEASLVQFVDEVAKPHFISANASSRYAKGTFLFSDKSIGLRKGNQCRRFRYFLLGIK
jgi:hypothetical protein